MRGDLTALTESIAMVKEELEFTSHKTVRNEMEIFKLVRAALKVKASNIIGTTIKFVVPIFALIGWI